MLVESSSSADSIKSSRTTSSSGSDSDVENLRLQRLGVILSLLTGISVSDPYLCLEPFSLVASHASLMYVPVDVDWPLGTLSHFVFKNISHTNYKKWRIGKSLVYRLTRLSGPTKFNLIDDILP